MQLIPLKKKYNLTDQDINTLSALMIDGSSLADICSQFEDKLTAEKVFLVADVIAREMFDLTLQELCPELVAERRGLNAQRYQEWHTKKAGQKLLGLVREVLEDLSLFELELLSAARVKA